MTTTAYAAPTTFNHTHSSTLTYRIQIGRRADQVRVVDGTAALWTVACNYTPIGASFREVEISLMDAVYAVVWGGKASAYVTVPGRPRLRVSVA